MSLCLSVLRERSFRSISTVPGWLFENLGTFLATLLVLHFTPVSGSHAGSEFQTSVALRLASLFTLSLFVYLCLIGFLSMERRALSCLFVYVFVLAFSLYLYLSLYLSLSS